MSQPLALCSPTDSSSKLNLKWLGWCYIGCHSGSNECYCCASLQHLLSDGKVSLLLASTAKRCHVTGICLVPGTRFELWQSLFTKKPNKNKNKKSPIKNKGKSWETVGEKGVTCLQKCLSTLKIKKSDIMEKLE